MQRIALAAGSSQLGLPLAMANRHGLFAGATGTGKTVTLRVLAEGFSAAGVPVFLADVKGDLSGLAMAGGDNPKVVQRASQLGMTPRWHGVPVTFWDVFGRQGHPLRTTISEMGPLLLARLLELNDVQAGVLQLAFRVADDSGLLLLDLKDLRAMLQHVAEHATELRAAYGNVSAASVGAIQRSLLALETQGQALFGEPALDLADLLRTENGQGVVNILAADRLFSSPGVYATVLLWLLAELFEGLPEVGDADKPRLAFFFDEAHLLFDNAPAALVDKVEQVVRLVRSKGVGVYFATQNPLDLPDEVSRQLGLRVIHSLRAFSAKEQKVVRAVAQTFRPDPNLDAAQALLELATGEALVSLLDESGRPTVVQRALVHPPMSRLAPLDPAERQAIVRASPLAGRYEAAVDRESAHEVLTGRLAARQAKEPQGGLLGDLLGETGRRREGLVEAMAKSAARSIGSHIGRQIVRGVLGSLFGGR